MTIHAAYNTLGKLDHVDRPSGRIDGHFDIQGGALVPLEKTKPIRTMKKADGLIFPTADEIIETLPAKVRNRAASCRTTLCHGRIPREMLGTRRSASLHTTGRQALQTGLCR